MFEFLSRTFDTSDFPPRWSCGNWSEGHGWLHIFSDGAIFAAYLAIALVLVYFLWRRKDVPFLPVFWLFAAFILCCGIGHALEAALFWQPWYRLSGLVKLGTAIVSWATVVALVPIVPRALTLPGLAETNARLQRDLAERNRLEAELRSLNEALERRVQERTEQLTHVNQRLSQEQFLLRALVDNIPEPVFFKDRQSRFIGANRKMAHDAGFDDPAELVGKTDADIWAGRFSQETFVEEQRIMETGEPLINKEEKPMKAGGPERWVSVTKMPLRNDAGAITGLFGIAWDISKQKRQARELDANRRAALNIAQDAEEARRAAEGANSELQREIARRRQAEQELREAHAFLDSIVEHVPLLLFVKRADDLRYERLNKVGAQMLGIEQEAIVGRGDHDLYPRAQADFFAAKDRETLQSKRLVDIPEEPIQTRHGKRLLHTRKIPILDGQGNPTHLLGISSDITERRQAEETLKHMAGELARSNAELEQFAYIASHDLQEPLRKVQAFGDMLAAGYREVLGDEGRDYLQRMQSASKRMTGLINDLLTLSRVTTKASPFHPVNLAEVARQVTSDLEIRIRDCGGKVEIGDLPVLVADPLQMRQLLQNLIGNALKFHRPGTSPSVKVGSRLLGPAANGVRSWEITVADNGIGFDEKYLDRIFAPFQRLHGRDEYEGTGMGLAICKKIVERHGGTISVRSTAGQGATFIVCLPVHSEGEPADE